MYTKIELFETIMAFRLSWVKEPRHTQNASAEKYYLYRRTRLIAEVFGSYAYVR